jgi:hypothetical protein
MNSNTTTLEGGSNATRATKPSPITEIKNKRSEAACANSPKSKKSTREGEVSAQKEDTTSASGVTTKKATDTTVTETAHLVPDEILVTPKAPVDDNLAGEHESTNQDKFIIAKSNVDSGASFFDEGASVSLADDHSDFDEDYENDKMIIEEVLREGGMIDDLFWYGSRHEPSGSTDVESDGSDCLRAACGDSRND